MPKSTFNHIKAKDNDEHNGLKSEPGVESKEGDQYHKENVEIDESATARGLASQREGLLV